MQSNELTLWYGYNNKYGIHDPVWSDAYLANVMCRLQGAKTQVQDHMPVRRKQTASGKASDARWMLWAKQMAKHKRG